MQHKAILHPPAATIGGLLSTDTLEPFLAIGGALILATIISLAVAIGRTSNSEYPKPGTLFITCFLAPLGIFAIANSDLLMNN